MNLDLEKGKESLKLSLQKHGVTTIPSADIAFVLDVSGSFHDAHRAGVTQRLLERLVPWGMVFDPDQKLDVFTFAGGQDAAHHVGDITPQTCKGYIHSHVVDKVPGYGGTTDYGYVLEKILVHFGWLTKKAGFFGRLMGEKNEQNAKRRSIVLFVTDGDNFDKDECRKLLRESEQRGDEIYFLFIAIASYGGHFPFLQEVADAYSNTGLSIINDFKAFVDKTDEELNADLIGSELVTWLKK